MKYSLRTNTGYEHFAKKFERTVRMLGEMVRKWQFVCEFLLFVSAFWRARMAFTSSLTRSVMWAQVDLRYWFQVLAGFSTFYLNIQKFKQNVVKKLKRFWAKKKSMKRRFSYDY